MLEHAVPQDVFEAAAVRWDVKVAAILNASTEELTISDLHDMIQADPPTLTDKWPDTYIAKLKRNRDADPTGALIRRLEKK